MKKENSKSLKKQKNNSIIKIQRGIPNRYAL